MNPNIHFRSAVPAVRLLVFGILVLALASCAKDGPDNPGADSFEGRFTDIPLTVECDGLSEGDFEIAIMAEDGTLLSRRATHSRSGQRSLIRLRTGLKEGTYRLLHAAAIEPEEEYPIEFGFGSRINISAKGVSVLDDFNSELGFAGQGTADDPLIVSSSSHLFNLMMAVNDYDSNRLITKDTYFLQVCDIDMKSMSRSCDSHYGWMPIGADTNTPFRGVYLGDGHEIRNLIISRPATPGVGLFGYVIDAQYAVGTIVGAVIDSGDNRRGTVAITNCSTDESTVEGNSTSAMVGGIIGAVDMHSKALLSNCSVTGGSVKGNINTGGILGGAAIYSSVMMSACTGRTPVTGLGSGTGGLVGTTDTLQAVGCVNYERVMGPAAAPRDNPGIGIDILFVDSEDYGTDGDDESWALGARYFASNPIKPDYRPSRAVLLDMVGGKGAVFPAEYFSREAAAWLDDQFRAAAVAAGHGDRFPKVYGGAVTDDHVELIKQGIPAIDIIDYRAGEGFNPTWHTMDDNLDNIDPESLRAVGESLVGFIYQGR